VSTRSRQAG